MTPNEQIVALAELDGWTLFEAGKDSFGTWCEPHATREQEGVLQSKLPSYLSSYDAIIPLIQKQSVSIRVKIAQRHPRGITFMSSPAQLAEALLRATGKWKE